MLRLLAAGAALLALSLTVSGCQAVQQEQGRQSTVAWLQTQGMDKSSAILLANNKPALRQYLMNKSMAGQDDAYCRSLGSSPGSSTYVQCRTSMSANRPVYQPPKQHFTCTSGMAFGTVRTDCE